MNVHSKVYINAVREALAITPSPSLGLHFQGNSPREENSSTNYGSMSHFTYQLPLDKGQLTPLF